MTFYFHPTQKRINYDPLKLVVYDNNWSIISKKDVMQFIKNKNQVSLYDVVSEEQPLWQPLSEYEGPIELKLIYWYDKNINYVSINLEKWFKKIK